MTDKLATLESLVRADPAVFDKICGQHKKNPEAIRNLCLLAADELLGEPHSLKDRNRIDGVIECLTDTPLRKKLRRGTHE
jgi:hypothetical protein